MDNLLDSMKNIFKKRTNNSKNQPNFYLESNIIKGCLPFSTASVEVLAFSDEERTQRIRDITIKWFRNIEGTINYSFLTTTLSYKWILIKLLNKIFLKLSFKPE